METLRLNFRTHQPEDEAQFVRMHTDLNVRRYVGGRAWSVQEATERFRQAYLGKPKRTYGLWAAELKSDGRYIGACGLIGSQRHASLAYYIAPQYWSRGLATEAAKAFVEVGFHRLQLAHIFADV
ncbi:MAG TPA: GNAT family N-acetyltransferase, partial [Candidatus Baltobacteraceae bacterium]|nr:GNAT family N-acetyltransferase [Candidatus Baltobacteraceae bacterium]